LPSGYFYGSESSHSRRILLNTISEAGRKVFWQWIARDPFLLAIYIRAVGVPAMPSEHNA
jgi:hypothetical protein